MDRSTDLAWRKSSHSGGGGENCVEVASIPSGGTAVRDSKDPRGPSLKFEPGEWQSFIVRVKRGEID